MQCPLLASHDSMQQNAVGSSSGVMAGMGVCMSYSSCTS
jgi:hypothetical protein